MVRVLLSSLRAKPKDSTRPSAPSVRRGANLQHRVKLVRWSSLALDACDGYPHGMTLPAKRPATYADILALPEQVVGEVLAGELVVSPRPAPRHSAASSALGATLGPPFQFGDGGPGGWWILDEPELHLENDVVVPDLAGWRRERMPSLPEDAFIDIAPDWVCEILSPSTSRVDRTRKVPRYADAAIPHLWLIDPNAQTLEAYRLESGHWVLVSTHGGDDRVSAVPFEVIGVDLGRLWPRP